jgi:uncharacterized PurR-regulated membrane protein YhhQ (DUF165 family)
MFDVAVAAAMALILFGIAKIPEVANDNFMSGWLLGAEGSELETLLRGWLDNDIITQEAFDAAMASAGSLAPTALNDIIGNSLPVVGVSLFAFIVSSGVDILSNITIGKWMRNSKAFKGQDGKRSIKGFFVYFTRAYTSTFLSQLTDNIVFQFIAYNFLFAWFYGFSNAPGALLFNGKVQLGLFIGALVGAVAELIMELAFAPIGYFATTKKKTEQTSV